MPVYRSFSTRACWCGEGDSNPYVFRHAALNRARLPITAPPHNAHLVVIFGMIPEQGLFVSSPLLMTPQHAHDGLLKNWNQRCLPGFCAIHVLVSGTPASRSA